MLARACLVVLTIVFFIFAGLYLVRPLWTVLPSEPKGPVVAARIVSMNPGYRLTAHTMRITVRDGDGRIGGFNVPARLNTCRIGSSVAVRRIGIKLAVEPGQCRRPE